MKHLLPNHRSGVAPSFYVGDDVAEACQLLSRESQIAVDIETMGLGSDAFRVKAVIMATRDYAVVLDATNARHKELGCAVLAAVPSLLFHNADYDVPPLVADKWLSLSDIGRITDTLILARLAYTDAIKQGRGLGDLEERHLSDQFLNAVKDRLAYARRVAGWKKGEEFANLQYADPVYTMYAAWDGIVTARLLEPLTAAARNQLTDHPFGKYGADQETATDIIADTLDLSRLSIYRAARGLRVDRDQVKQTVAEYREIQDGHASTMTGGGIADFSNRNQLIDALGKAGAISPDHPRTDLGALRTDKGTLEALTHPLANAFREYDKARRMIHYMEEAVNVADAADGRLHPSINILGAATGRMSISQPPLQQMQGRSRHAILADEGRRMVSIDWASIEPVVGAALSGDRAVLDLYDARLDLYEPAAQLAGIPRKQAKIMSLADLYGQGIEKMAAQFGLTSDKAREIKATLRSAMPKTAEFIEYSRAWGELTGKTWTLAGRIVDVDAAHSYKATNYTIQGSAYDQLAHTAAEIWRRGMADGYLIPVHDEIVCHDDIADEVQEIMETPHPRLVELSGRTNRLRTDREELGEHWDEA